MKETNKRGFTLIELLAVIVVLALIMILAIPSILTATDNAKKKTFQMYGQRLLESAMSQYTSDKMLDIDPPKSYGAEGVADENKEPCYSIADLGYETSGSYQGFVVIHPSDLAGQTTYSLYLTDNMFGYNNAPSSDVFNDPKKISGDGTVISAIKAELPRCS